MGYFWRMGCWGVVCFKGRGILWNVIVIMRVEILVVVWLLVGSCYGQCQTAACLSRNPPTVLSLLDPKMVSQALEAELRRQFWYYLRDATLINRTITNSQDRLIVYLYHRNILGTFLSITSYFYRQKISQVNAMLRIGNGWAAPTRSGVASRDPVEPDPRLLILNDRQWSIDLTNKNNPTATMAHISSP